MDILKNVREKSSDLSKLNSKYAPNVYQYFIKMYFNKYEETEIGDLHHIPNLFVLYNKYDNTITYNGRIFNIYKKTKKAIENNFTIYK